MIDETVTRYDEHGIYIYKLSDLRGRTDEIIKRIPSEMGGIYLWYNSYNSLVSGGDFKEEFWAAIKAPNHAERKTKLGPDGIISLKSSPDISAGKKENIEDLIDTDSFQKEFKQYIDKFSILFESPLYIGKTNNFRKRIREHLEGNSALKERLLDHGIQIESCNLIIIESQLNNSKENIELNYEEIFSRLFTPKFNERIG
jgi:hypothetical protein